MALADAAGTAIRFVTNVYYVYLFLIFVYIILSWIRLPYSVWLNRIQRFLYDVVNPYLALFRRLLPMLRIGMLDLTPLIAIVALTAIWRLVVFGIDRLHS